MGGGDRRWDVGATGVVAHAFHDGGWLGDGRGGGGDDFGTAGAAVGVGVRIDVFRISLVIKCVGHYVHKNIKQCLFLHVLCLIVLTHVLLYKPL